MDQKQLFSMAMGHSEPWFIDSLTFSPEQKLLDIHLDFRRRANFPLPGETGTRKAYDTVEKTWRHLNFFQDECYLHYRTPRVQLKPDSATVPGFLLDLKAHGGESEKIERLSMDMSPAFISAAERFLPKAQITFDRFLYHEAYQRGRGRGGSRTSFTKGLACPYEESGEPHGEAAAAS